MQTNKKGLSLIEVVVSLSILAIVFVGTITLIVNVVNLVLITRDKTEATALMQKGLTKGIDRAKDSCRGSVDYDETLEEINGKYTITVTNSDDFEPINSTAGDGSISKDNFVSVKSKVEWSFKNQDYLIESNQYVSKVKE